MNRRGTSGHRVGRGAVPVEEALEAIPGGAVLIDPDGRVALVNRAGEQILGRGREGLIGESIESWLGEPFLPIRERLLSADRSAAALPPTHTARCRLAAPGPFGLLVDVTLTPLPVGEEDMVLATVRDVSDQALSEARLGLLEAFAEASSDAFLSTRDDGRIATWSRSAERISGFLEGEILGQPVAVLFPEHLRPEMKPVLDTVAAGERVDGLEVEIQRKDGMLIPTSLTMAPVLDRDGGIVGSVAIVQDITEMRLAQATLAEVEARLREGEALAHVGRWLWDVGTGAVQWSDEFHRIHGVDPLEFAGTFEAYMGCIHPADRGRVRDEMEKAVESGRGFEDEYRAVHTDGEVRWVYARAEPMVGSADVVVGLRGIGQDITDRRRGADPGDPLTPPR